MKAIYKLHKETHKIDGMFGSLDCTHTWWKNCPVAWQEHNNNSDHVDDHVDGNNNLDNNVGAIKTAGQKDRFTELSNGLEYQRLQRSIMDYVDTIYTNENV